MSEPFLFHMDHPKKGSHVLEAVISDLRAREERGVQKYGCTMDRQDLSLRDWLQHTLEETMDKALYLKKAIMEIDNSQTEKP